MVHRHKSFFIVFDFREDQLPLGAISSLFKMFSLGGNICFIETQFVLSL